MSSVAWEKRYCRDCTWRADDGMCLNGEKLHDPPTGYEILNGDTVTHYPEFRDHLVYEYSEGGSFWVGPDFGCVHWRERDSERAEGDDEV